MTAQGQRALRWTGALADLSPSDRRELLGRGARPDDDATRDVRRAVARIVADVRERGDEALLELASRLDGVDLAALEVPRGACVDALARTPDVERRALERAARSIERVHAAQRPAPIEIEPEPGVVVGRRPDPLARAGVYAPGGRAAYPSSVLMGAIPARVAGVREVILCSPPRADGLPSPCVLAAAALAGVDRVFAVGGAGAVAAMAYGTRSIPRVDVVVGPGNAYVAEAKRAVIGDVAIDALAGPSEILAIVDGDADLDAVARELIAQAEHDPSATACALAVGEGVAAALASRVGALAARAERGDVVRGALASRGAVLAAPSIDDAIALANDLAAEHVLIAAARPEVVLARLTGAGTVLLGERSSVAFGDYMTGANHVLPTAGAARFQSGLSLADFHRWTTYQRVTAAAAARLADDVARLASSEGLLGHAAAAAAWRPS